MATTTKVSVDEYLSKRGAHVGKTVGGSEAVFKGFSAPSSWNPEARSATFVMSSERIDRDGDIVRQKGARLDDFVKNPQALLFHNSRTWPVGQWGDIQKRLQARPPRTEGVLTFAPSGGPIPEIDQAAWAVENGLMRTVSIGFMPLDIELIEHKDGESAWEYGYDILSSDWFECSIIPLPAQPDAVAKDLLSKGEAQPAREFIEQALDEWARDPRTSMFVPRKELSDTYRRFFGKSAVMVMALDSVVPAEKSALRRVEEAVAQAAEEHGLKQLPGDFTDPPPAPAEGEIEAVSGIEIEFPITVNLTITQGNTGANTRVGTDVGDQGTAAADASVQTVPPSQRDVEPEHKEPHPLLVRAKGVLKRFFGGDEPPTPEPTLVPGAYEQRKERIAAALECLRPH